jgi:signal peptide peptidase SppA
MYTLPRIWAGTQESLDCLVQAMAQAHMLVQARARAMPMDSELEPLLVVQDGVARLDLRGSLTSGSAGWMRMFGILGYDDIQAAMEEALTSKSVKAIMLNVSSGGGAVEGADETSEAIRRAATIKPVLTYAGGPMASAAYWLGSAGNRRLGSRTSVVGSIGTLVVHMESSEMLKKDGIKATVFRSGKFKGLGNPYEPLSSEAEDQIQGTIDAMNSVFEERVALNLGVTQKTVQTKMGQGRQFIGAQAVEAGLLDGIASYQEATLTAKLLAGARG